MQGRILWTYQATTMINHITSISKRKWFPNQTNMKPISSTVCRVVASKLRGLLLLQWSSTLNLIHANLFVHATAQPLPASRAANGLRRRRRLYLQLTVARPAQMLMLVSAQEQLMPITTLSALTTLQSTATTFIIKKVATVRGVRWRRPRWRRAYIIGWGTFWSSIFKHSCFHKISLKIINRKHAATMNIHKKPSYKHPSSWSGLDFLNNKANITMVSVSTVQPSLNQEFLST